MTDSPYNKLPKDIIQKFQIVYSELIYDNITMFKNKSEKWGVLTEVKKIGTFSTYEYLIEPFFNSTGLNKDINLIEAVKYYNDEYNEKSNIYYFFDTKGSIIWQSEKGDYIRTDKFKNVFICRNNKIGLFDKEFNQLIEPTYEQLSAINNKFYRAYKNGKYGIINIEGNTILEFKYTEIFNASFQDKIIIKADNEKYYSFDIANNSLVELPFDVILRASSNSYRAPTQKSYNLYKSIMNAKKNNEFDNYEMAKYKGDWGIIDGGGNVLIPNEYCFVDFLRNPKYFKIGIGDMEIRYIEGSEQGYRLSIENVKWGIIDVNNKIIVPIEYDWIDERESTIWVVSKGGKVFYNDDYQEDYWETEGGKLGVYNLEKLIVPIEYDTILINWFRIKDYIFVQKGKKYFEIDSKDYDVFSLNGTKIEVNKPNPRSHIATGND